MGEGQLIKEMIEEFMKLLPELTQHEADLIEIVLRWDSEKKAAFIMAKKMFEDKEEDERRV